MRGEAWLASRTNLVCFAFVCCTEVIFDALKIDVISSILPCYKTNRSCWGFFLFVFYPKILLTRFLSRVYVLRNIWRHLTNKMNFMKLIKRLSSRQEINGRVCRSGSGSKFRYCVFHRINFAKSWRLIKFCSRCYEKNMEPFVKQPSRNCSSRCSTSALPDITQHSKNKYGEFTFSKLFTVSTTAANYLICYKLDCILPHLPQNKMLRLRDSMSCQLVYTSGSQTFWATHPLLPPN